MRGVQRLALRRGLTLTSTLEPPRRSAAAKLENAITSQNESYLNNQTDQQALLIRHACPAIVSYLASERFRAAGGKTRISTS